MAKAARTSRKYKLTVVEGPHAGESRILRKRQVAVGGSEEAGFRLDRDTYLSSMHFRIAFENGRHHLHDLNSRNGTYLNGVLQPGGCDVLLNPGDQLRAGHSLLKYEARLSEGPAMPPLMWAVIGSLGLSVLLLILSGGGSDVSEPSPGGQSLKSAAAESVKKLLARSIEVHQELQALFPFTLEAARDVIARAESCETKLDLAMAVELRAQLSRWAELQSEVPAEFGNPAERLEAARRRLEEQAIRKVYDVIDLRAAGEEPVALEAYGAFRRLVPQEIGRARDLLGTGESPPELEKLDRAFREFRSESRILEGILRDLELPPAKKKSAAKPPGDEK